MKVKVKFVKAFGSHAVGDVVEFDADQANELILAGLAEKAVEAGQSWVKLIKAVAGQQVGAVVRVDAAAAQAWIAKGIAEAAADPTPPTLEDAIARATDAVVAKATGAVEESFKRLAQTVDAGARRMALPAAPKGEDDPAILTGGFKSLGHFAYAVLKGMKPGGSDPSIRAQLASYADVLRKAPSGMYEGSDPDGGLLVPPQMAADIWDKARAINDNLVSRAQVYPVRGNSMSFRGLAETSRANGSRFGGVQAYWEGEADQIASSRPKFDDRFLRLKKLAALTYVTQEQLDDSEIALEQFLTRLVAQEINFKIGDAMLHGTGAGQPQGVLKAACLATVAKESGQAAATIVYQNALKMWGALYAPSRSTAIWLVNQEVEQQLYQMSLSVGTGGAPVFLPSGGAASAPYATLFGRPLIPVEWCAALGTVGDIVLADWSQYLMITKAAGPTAASSMHLRFDYDEQAFRWTFRLDGQPAWRAALTPYKGSQALSPFVTLATRA